MEATIGKKENTVMSFEDEEDIEFIKGNISSHPLYELLVQTHLDCLKVSSSKVEEVGGPRELIQTKNKVLSMSMTNHSELDQFMQAYCISLSELKEGMTKILHESTAFIDSMHFQLEKLMDTRHPSNTTSPTSSGEIEG